MPYNIFMPLPRKFSKSRSVIYKLVGGRNRPGKYLVCPLCKKPRWVAIDNISRSQTCNNCRIISENKKCLQCNEEFKPRNRYAIYCSQICFYASKLTGIYKVCEQCGKEFYVAKSNSLSARFCSQFCTKKHFHGSNHPAYKNGNYVGGKNLYPYGGKWPSIREEVKRRDGYKCQWPKCNSSENLEVHHIESIWKLKSQRKANKFDNLITYCAHHHNAAHSHK